MKILNLAAAQITCQDGKTLENLARATPMAEQAHAQGAQLVLFPEFMPQGYRLTPDLWDSAEAFDGPTTRWLGETSCCLGIYLGVSFLEARNGQFLNTFALAEPSGKIVGAVRNPSIMNGSVYQC
jgi:predicted amidohydrolase